ncbi:MAG TPA: hypothetical protein VI112_10235 [Bacteroidia bacterium]
MKTTTLKTLILTLLLVVAGAVASPVAFSQNAHANAAAFKEGEYKGGVTDDQIIAYLESKGYTNVHILKTDEKGNRLCSSDYSYYTIVYVEGDQIVGAEDIQD